MKFLIPNKKQIASEKSQGTQNPNRVSSRLDQYRSRDARWRVADIRQMILRPGTQAGFWEGVIEKGNGTIVKLLITVPDNFSGDHRPRRRVKKYLL